MYPFEFRSQYSVGTIDNREWVLSFHVSDLYAWIYHSFWIGESNYYCSIEQTIKFHYLKVHITHYTIQGTS